MFQQRLFTIATGYEDLNDHKRMCSDVTLQTAVGGFNLLACTATLAAMDLEAIIQSHRPFWEQFIAGHRQPPKRIGHRYTLAWRYAGVCTVLKATRSVEFKIPKTECPQVTV